MKFLSTFEKNHKTIMSLKFFRVKYDKEIGIISFYFTLYLVFTIFHSTDFNLVESSNFYFSQATKDGVDISKRISIFYKIIGLISVLLIVFYFFISKIHQRFNINTSKIEYSIPFAFIGILLLVSNLLGINNKKSIELIFYIFILSYFLSFLRIRHSRFQYLQKLLPFILVFSFILHSFFVLFVNSDDFFLKNSLGYYLVICILSLFIVSFLKNQLKSFRKIAKALIPISFIPIWIFISIETEFFIKLNYNFFLSFRFIFIFLVVLGYVIWYLFSRYKHFNFSSNSILDRFLVPSALLSFLLLTLYHPFFNQSTELFETANPSNSLLRILKYNEFPFVDFLSSHMFSEQFYGLIHSFIFGYDNKMSYMSYAFMYDGIFFFLAFFFLKKLLKNGSLALLFVFSFPYFTVILYPNIFFGIIAFYQVLKLIENQKAKSFLKLYIILILLIFWRLDTGIATLMAVFFFVIILYFSKGIKLNYKNLFRSILYFSLCLGSILFIIILLKSPSSLIDNFKNALHYISASQAHGYSSITNDLNQQIVLYHYIFPLVSVVAIFYMAFKININRTQNTQNFIYYSSIFLHLLFLSNFQRGLVRHSFFEGSESFLISTFYLALTLLIFSFLKNQKAIWKFISFFSISFIVIIVLKYFPLERDVKSHFENYLTETSIKNIDINFQNPNYNGKVIQDSSFQKNNYKDFVKFLNYNLTKKQSFFDFSNTPILYYYSGRKVPSYFCQNLQNTIDDYLQLDHLKYLNVKDYPVVVYSNYPQNGFDKTDDVPNSLRYYLLAEYIYKNYRPFGIINNRSVWIADNFNIKSNKIYEKDTTINTSTTISYVRSAYYLNNYLKKSKLNLFKKASLFASSTDSNYSYFKVPNIISSKKGYFLKLITNKTQFPQEFKVEVLDKENNCLSINTFYSVPEKKEYMIRWSNHFLIHLKKAEKIRISRFNNDKITNLVFYLDER
jgi:hypothetical protein